MQQSSGSDTIYTDLELGILSGVETVHATEPLAGRAPTEQLHLSLPRQTLSRWVGLISLCPQRERESERQRQRQRQRERERTRESERQRGRRRGRGRGRRRERVRDREGDKERVALTSMTRRRMRLQSSVMTVQLG